jgi:thiol-disulfide isomerase/thioredoxin
MVQEASVVTPERYAQGLTYDQYMQGIKVNKARFEEYYANIKLQPGQAAALRELTTSEGGPNHMMVIGEDWCGDVVRELPVLARFAEAAGLELRIFPRDENHDIMNEYLKEGLYMSIPVAVFYTKDHDYICHWIERSQAANREQGEIETAIRAEQPDIDDQDFGRQRRARTAARAGDWQQATMDELEGLLREHLH